MNDKDSDKLGLLQILVLLLSTYILIALAVDTFFKLPKQISNLIEITDTFICIVFFIDFSHRYYKAEKKLQFLKWGWIDLIASIPSIEILRTGRLIRLIRLLRILRAFKSIKLLMAHIFKNRAKGTFTAVVSIAILMLFFSSIAMLTVEDDPSSNIKTSEDALWWAFVTITTVGYGDKYPVTTEGRLVAALLMTTGVGLFGSFTGYVASWFMGHSDKDNEVE